MANNDLVLNTSKTKLIIVRKGDVGHLQLIVNNELIRKVNNLKYLGC